MIAAVRPPIILDRSDDPVAVDADQIRDVPSAMIDFAVHQEFERCPQGGNIAVHMNYGIVNAFLMGGRP